MTSQWAGLTQAVISLIKMENLMLNKVIYITSNDVINWSFLFLLTLWLNKLRPGFHIAEWQWEIYKCNFGHLDEIIAHICLYLLE